MWKVSTCRDLIDGMSSLLGENILQDSQLNMILRKKGRNRICFLQMSLTFSIFSVKIPSKQQVKISIAAKQKCNFCKMFGKGCCFLLYTLCQNCLHILCRARFFNWLALFVLTSGNNATKSEFSPHTSSSVLYPFCAHFAQL